MIATEDDESVAEADGERVRVIGTDSGTVGLHPSTLLFRQRRPALQMTVLLEEESLFGPGAGRGRSRAGHPSHGSTSVVADGVEGFR